MRILVVSDLPQFVTGGAEMQAARLIGAWRRAGHEVICLGRRAVDGTVEIDGHTIAVRRIRTWSGLGRLGRAASYAWSLGRILWELRNWPDVVYTRFLGDAAVTVSIVKAMGWFRAPLVPTPANAGPEGDISYLRSVPGSEFLIRLLDRHCDAINLIAPSMAADLRTAGFRQAHLHSIPNGIPVAALRKSDRHGALRIVSVGRLAHQKGYDFLIEALRGLPDAVSQGVRFEIIGEGPLREQLASAASALPTGLLSFPGEMSPLEVRERLEHADLFVLSSRYEGMSNAALEAMERGVPLLVTRCGGIDAYLDDSMGWVVPPADPAALTGAIASAVTMGREQLRKRGLACRRLVEEEFAMPVVSARYLALFEALASEVRRNHP